MSLDFVQRHRLEYHRDRVIWSAQLSAALDYVRRSTRCFDEGVYLHQRDPESLLIYRTAYAEKLAAMRKEDHDERESLG
jgi:hypothetical protein